MIILKIQLWEKTLMKETVSIQHNFVRAGERVVSLDWPPACLLLIYPI